MNILKKIPLFASIAALFLSFAIPPVSIYSFTITTNSGQSISLNQYQNKKIVLVNIATTGKFITQLEALQQFYNKHKDSVLVIGFPSNSFNNTPQGNNGIAGFLAAKGITFPVVNKADVKGSNAHVLYKWLNNASQNGIASITIGEDFEKILISKHGKIAGIFRAEVEPGAQSISLAMADN